SLASFPRVHRAENFAGVWDSHPASARAPSAKTHLRDGFPRPGLSVLHLPSARLCSPSRLTTRQFRCPQILAGEEGFEPPLSVLETDGLPLNLLPFTLRTRRSQVRRVYPPILQGFRLPFSILRLDKSQFLRLQLLISFSLRRAAAENPHRSLQINSTGLRF